MATIRKLTSGRYNCQIRKRGSRTKSRSFDTEAEAKSWVELENGKLRKTTLKCGTLNFRELGTSYVATFLAGRPSQYQTLGRVERIAHHFKQPLCDISKWDVNDFKLKRLTQVNGTTCRDELLLLRRVFRWAKREMLIDIESPCENVTLPRASKPRNKVITPDELQLLLQNVSKDMRPIIELAYETAMRRAEILKLTPSCLHLNERVLDVINGKTGDRSVPLTKRATELLEQAKQRCPSPHSRLFPFSPCCASQALRRARIKLGMSDDIRFHQLRHTRISMVARKGFNQAQIMMVSGHRDSRSVQRYTHLNVVDVIDLLE